MGITQDKSKRKVSGGKYFSYRKKRKFETANQPANTKVGTVHAKTKRIRGGNSKNSLLRSDMVNIVDGKKHVKAKIIRVTESPANRNFVRRNILTKGTVIETDKGSAKITNRPGQEGSINAILIK
jgi:small subunit ribosomal protein S8e